MAPLPKPYITKYFREQELGNVYLTYYTRKDLDIYCDDCLSLPYKSSRDLRKQKV